MAADSFGSSWPNSFSLQSEYDFHSVLDNDKSTIDDDWVYFLWSAAPHSNVKQDHSYSGWIQDSIVEFQRREMDNISTPIEVSTKHSHEVFEGPNVRKEAAQLKAAANVSDGKEESVRNARPRPRRREKAAIEKNHHCQHPRCSMSFRYPKDLRRHEVTHEANRQGTYYCSYVECYHAMKGFQRKDGLQRHMKNIHGEGSSANAFRRK